MADYKEMYYRLFNKVSDVIGELQEIQAQAEEMFINSDSAENNKE